MGLLAAAAAGKRHRIYQCFVKLRHQPTGGPGGNRAGTVPELPSGTKGLQNGHFGHPTYHGMLHVWCLILTSFARWNFE